MNLSNKLNSILKEYSEGNKKSAYKKFKKIYLKNNKDIKLRYNLAVMQQELGLLDEAESNYITLIKNGEDICNRNFSFRKIDIDYKFPDYLLKNISKYRNWIQH